MSTSADKYTGDLLHGSPAKGAESQNAELTLHGSLSMRRATYAQAIGVLDI